MHVYRLGAGWRSFCHHGSVIVGTEASLGVGSIVKCGAVVEHHATVQDVGYLDLKARLAGLTVLGYRTKIQSGVTLDPG